MVIVNHSLKLLDEGYNFVLHILLCLMTERNKGHFLSDSFMINYLASFRNKPNLPRGSRILFFYCLLFTQ